MIVPILKYTYRFSISLILVILAILIFRHFAPIEFTNEQEEFSFETFCFFAFESAILLTLTGTIKRDDGLGWIVSKVLLTVFFIVAIFFITALSVMGDMCRSTIDKILFENIENNSVKIVQRNFGCGATDSGSPTIGLFKVKFITSHFIWVTKIDTTKLDTKEWKRIEKASK